MSIYCDWPLCFGDAVSFYEWKLCQKHRVKFYTSTDDQNLAGFLRQVRYSDKSFRMERRRTFKTNDLLGLPDRGIFYKVEIPFGYYRVRTGIVNGNDLLWWSGGQAWRRVGGYINSPVVKVPYPVVRIAQEYLNVDQIKLIRKYFKPLQPCSYVSGECGFCDEPKFGAHAYIIFPGNENFLIICGRCALGKAEEAEAEIKSAVN